MSSTTALLQAPEVAPRSPPATSGADAGPVKAASAYVPTRPVSDWTARMGFWSGVLAAGFSLVFSIASVPVLLGAVGPPWDNVLTLVPSLLLAPCLLVLLVYVDAGTLEHDRLWSRLGVAFAGIYVALVSVV